MKIKLNSINKYTHLLFTGIYWRRWVEIIDGAVRFAFSLQIEWADLWQVGWLVDWLAGCSSDANGLIEIGSMNR